MATRTEDRMDGQTDVKDESSTGLLVRLCSAVSLGSRHKSTPHQHHYKRRREEREEKRHEEMENDMWPFYSSTSSATISKHVFCFFCFFFSGCKLSSIRSLPPSVHPALFVHSHHAAV